MREKHAAGREEKKLITLSEARKNRLITDWNSNSIRVPLKPGYRILKDIDLKELALYIDWTFFFFAWKISGKYPALFSDPVKGPEAKKLFDDAQYYLKEIIDKKIVVSSAVLGIFPAKSDDDDIEIIAESQAIKQPVFLRFLRNQEQKEKGVPNLSLSDFVAPGSSGLADHIGLFVVSADIDEKKYLHYKEDDYASIMIRILSDRLAEAAAEWLHEKVRKEYWGYAADEALTVEEMLAVKYQGIRPAPGYPACPDHTEKRVLFNILDAENAIGTRLTENFAMTPPASVSGYFFSHPESSYFNIGKLGQDQLADYARRKKMSIEDAARWLAPNL
jgi:5-methyltetrahydrofolate--homocysteine methyltransferase